jgi:hypothetical protein
VAGAVRDVKYARLTEEPRPYLYLPVLQRYQSAIQSLDANGASPADVLRRFLGRGVRLAAVGAATGVASRSRSPD